MPGTLKEKFDRAEYVTKVTVNKVESDNVFFDEDIPAQKIYFYIQDNIKGNYTQKSVLQMQPQSGLCGIPVNEGDEVILFISKIGYTSMCFGTFVLKTDLPKTLKNYSTLMSFKYEK